MQRGTFLHRGTSANGTCHLHQESGMDQMDAVAAAGVAPALAGRRFLKKTENDAEQSQQLMQSSSQIPQVPQNTQSQQIQQMSPMSQAGQSQQSAVQAYYSYQPVCPTPYALGSVCGRGERELPNWRGARNSAELLGTYGQMMGDTARYIFDVVASYRGTQSSLRLLSAADGCSDDTQPDMQARRVPTSIMLAHAFCMGGGVWQDEHTLVRVYGGDVRNVVSPWWQPQRLPWHMPPWLEHRFVALDNTRDFITQLFANSQCEPDQYFDVVMVRQGLCFCDDPSKTSTTWPLEVQVTRAQDSVVCGIYRLEPYLFEGRPQYRKGHCVLQWCTARGEWAVQDVAGGTWAYARGDVGHPVLARGPWAVWDGVNHVSDASFSCELAQHGEPPWKRPPQQRLCCCGVTGDCISVLHLLERVASVLDARQPHSFGLLHGAWTNGTKLEVEQLHQQIEEASRLFNLQRRGPHVAAVLWRTAAKQYWLQCDGIMLYQPGSRADPFCAVGLAQYNRNACPSSL